MAAAARSRKHMIRLVWADGNALDVTESMTAAEAIISSENDVAGKQAEDSSCNIQMNTVGAALSNTNAWLVCDSATLRVGKRACPVHPDALLERGHLYFVLPMAVFQQRLPWSYIAFLAAMAASATAAGGAAPPTSSAAFTQYLTFARVPLLKSYLAFFLIRPRRRCRAFLAKLGRRQRLDDAHIGADQYRRAHNIADADASLSLSHSISNCSIRALHNVCHSSEAHCKYVEQLIDRSNSWRPPLLTIHE